MVFLHGWVDALVLWPLGVWVGAAAPPALLALVRSRLGFVLRGWWVAGIPGLSCLNIVCGLGYGLVWYGLVVGRVTGFFAAGPDEKSRTKVFPGDGI